MLPISTIAVCLQSRSLVLWSTGVVTSFRTLPMSLLNTQMFFMFCGQFIMAVTLLAVVRTCHDMRNKSVAYCTCFVMVKMLNATQEKPHVIPLTPYHYHTLGIRTSRLSYGTNVVVKIGFFIFLKFTVSYSKASIHGDT